jgi:hypothetical protein
MSNVRQPEATMRIAKLLASSAFGFGVFLVAVVLVGGMAMAIPVSPSYYAVFRPLGGNAPALALVSLFVWGLPVAAVVAAGFFVVLRVLRAPYGLLSVCGIAGMVIAFLVLTDFKGFTGPFVWWGIPHVSAPWLGAAVAVWLARPRSAPDARAVA